MICFTTASIKDLPKARVLAKSIRQFHPDWSFYVVLIEPWADSIEPSREEYSIIAFDQVGIEPLYPWLFMHNEMETKLAIKGASIQYLFNTINAEKILFLDTSTILLAPFDEVETWLDRYSICLTPRFRKPAIGTRQILRQEVAALREGTFDLGFLALRKDNQGTIFANWWGDRIFRYCYQNDERAIYFDQRWCDLAPILFDNLYIIRDPSCIVNTRDMQGDKFIKTSAGWFMDERRIKAVRLVEFAEPNYRAPRAYPVVEEFYTWYKNELSKSDQDKVSTRRWLFDSYNNGELITDDMRWLYRQRIDLRIKYPQPFDAKSNNSLYGFFVWQESRRPKLKSVRV